MMRQRSVRSFSHAVLIAMAILVCVRTACADGGRLRFRQQAGTFIVTLFTTPDPLTQGPADFSVAVERAGQPGLVEGANVEIVLTPASGNRRSIVLHATRAAATSKWLQAANFRLPSRGLWNVTVMVRHGNEAGQCSGTVRVGAAGTRDVVWDVLPVPVVALFLLVHQRRRRNYKREQRSRLISSVS